eukprot:TRINITY_DN2080_c0_g2_i3.p1 TRINITY_DN2080_c0_g2~~TRINITY_DN2080_c0_g2_i3.p1  ORF type:complete len:484 (-),score=203.12 TRINITY_DN2080_c0_g2_i3:489-1895(-)
MAVEGEAAASATPAAPDQAPAAAPPADGDVPHEEDWKLQAEEFKTHGNEAFKKGQWQEAIDWYSKAIDLDPEDRVYYSNRSAAYLKLGDAKSKALKDAEKCVALGKDWSKAYSRLGAAQHALKRYDAAIESFRIGLSLEPDSKPLKDGMAAAEAGQEAERKARWEAARIERDLQAAEKAAEDAAKKRQEKAAGTGVAKADEAAVSEDPLNSFFTEIGSEAARKAKEAKQLKDKYTAQDMGTPEQQINRLVGPNFKWKNLNPYEVLMLDTDATVEDIKQRYRKLSTLVHPDKRLDMPLARDAFEEVKQAYQQLIDDDRRKLAVATIEAVRLRVAKERARLVAKGGLTPQALEAQHSSADAHARKAVMKEFASIEMRRREIEEHKQAQKKRERSQEDEEQAKLKKTFAREKEWNEEEGRDKRMGNWRDFAKTGKAPKKAKMWKEEERAPPPGGRQKFAVEDANSYKKAWK